MTQIIIIVVALITITVTALISGEEKATSEAALVIAAWLLYPISYWILMPSTEGEHESSPQEVGAKLGALFSHSLSVGLFPLGVLAWAVVANKLLSPGVDQPQMYILRFVEKCWDKTFNVMVLSALIVSFFMFVKRDGLASTIIKALMNGLKKDKE